MSLKSAIFTDFFVIADRAFRVDMKPDQSASVSRSASVSHSASRSTSTSRSRATSDRINRPAETDRSPSVTATAQLEVSPVRHTQCHYFHALNQFYLNMKQSSDAEIPIENAEKNSSDGSLLSLSSENTGNFIEGHLLSTQGKMYASTILISNTKHRSYEPNRCYWGCCCGDLSFIL